MDTNQIKEAYKAAVPALFSHIEWSGDYGHYSDNTFDMNFHNSRPPYSITINLKPNPKTNGNRSERIRIFHTANKDMDLVMHRLREFIKSITTVFIEPNIKHG